jgi:hypothetical protein
MEQKKRMNINRLVEIIKLLNGSISSNNRNNLFHVITGTLCIIFATYYLLPSVAVLIVSGRGNN